MRYLTKFEICFLNKNNIKRFGGNFVTPNNFLHENSLDYLVDIVSADLFGEPMYPTLHQKAGVYLHNIICNHVFTDGNKRTGLDACILFLDFNQHQLSPNITNQILTDFIISVASGEQSLEAVQVWLKANAIPKI